MLRLSVTSGLPSFVGLLRLAACMACVLALSAPALAHGREGAKLTQEEAERSMRVISVIVLASLGVVGYYQYRKMSLLNQVRARAGQKPPLS